MKKRFVLKHCTVLCLIAVALGNPSTQAQEPASERPSGESGVIFFQSANSEFALLERQMREGNPEETAEAARRLIELALDKETPAGTRIQIAQNIFLSSALPEHRQKAFGVLFQHAPVLLKPHTQEIRIRVPNVSCYGRFQDSLREHLCQEHDWIYTVTAIDTRDVREGSTLPTVGTVAELIFIVDKNKQPQDLIAALSATRRYELDRWTILVETPVREMLKAAASPSEALESKN